MLELKKAIRTAQNFFPFLGEIKNEFYYYSRRYLRVAHESDFAVIAALPRLPDDLFLDIGANRGQSILSIRRYRKDARIISFEPNEFVYRFMKRHFVEGPRLTIMNCGLGTKETELTLFVPTYRGFVYDGNATFSEKAAFEYLSPNTLYFFNPDLLTVSRRTCQIRTLDSFGLAPSFVKIDVEGFELSVIEGGVETLRKHQPVIMIERYWHDARVFSLLADLGFGEVAVQEGRFVRAATDRPNALMMTDWRLKLCAT